MRDFCIYIATHLGDFHYAKALCQSIRYFCGSVPIVIFKDGDFSLSQLKRLGNVLEFNPAWVPDRLNCFTGTYSRLRALFVPEYERFLYLDADVLLLNNVLELPFRAYDFYVSPRPAHLNNPVKRAGRSRVYFDDDLIKQYDPSFVIDEGLILFPAGQFFGRSLRLDAEELLEHFHYARSTPKERSALPHADQSVLNYLLNKHRQQGRLTIGGSEFALMANAPEALALSGVSVESILAGGFRDRYLIHYLGPSRRLLLRHHALGAVLREFYRRYYRDLPVAVRWGDELRRLPSLLHRHAYAVYQHWPIYRLRRVGRRWCRWGR